MAILQPLLWGGGEEYTSLPGDVFFQRISPVLPCAEASQKTIMTAITLMRDERVCVCVCVAARLPSCLLPTGQEAC